jgi:hypothetical protein
MAAEETLALWQSKEHEVIDYLSVVKFSISVYWEKEL